MNNPSWSTPVFGVGALGQQNTAAVHETMSFENPLAPFPGRSSQSRLDHGLSNANAGFLQQPTRGQRPKNNGGAGGRHPNKHNNNNNFGGFGKGTVVDVRGGNQQYPGKKQRAQQSRSGAPRQNRNQQVQQNNQFPKQQFFNGNQQFNANANCPPKGRKRRAARNRPNRQITSSQNPGFNQTQMAQPAYYSEIAPRDVDGDVIMTYAPSLVEPVSSS